MSVSKVSLNEISAVRDSFPVASAPVAKKVAKIPEEKRFIDRFSDKKIAEFFTPYGYITHERSDDQGAVLVLCDGCQIIFDDFTVMVEPHVSLFSNNPDFDFGEFSALCEQANITPSQAISDRLEEEIFGSMPYYVERKKKFSDGNLARIKKNNKYGALLSASVQRQKHRDSFAPLNKEFGSTDPEKIADTLARTIPGR